MRQPVMWNQRQEPDWLRYTVQPPLGLITGDYYLAEKPAVPEEYGVTGHHGKLEVVVNDGQIVFVEFNERAMDAYYNQYFGGKDKRRSDYGIWQASKPRQAKAGVVLADGMLHVEAQILQRQSLEGEFDLLTGASGSMSGLLPLTTRLAKEVQKPSSRKFYGLAEDFGYGLTGWLRVVLEGERMVACKYDEIFADHQNQIRFPELRQYYRQSKYHSPCYQDPFPRGCDRHVWSINFRALMDLLEKEALKAQSLFVVDALPYAEGVNQGPLWDADAPFQDAVVNEDEVRYPSWDNYLKLAAELAEVLPAGFRP